VAKAKRLQCEKEEQKKNKLRMRKWRQSEQQAFDIIAKESRKKFLILY